MAKVKGVYLDTEKVRTMLRQRKMSAEDVVSELRDKIGGEDE